MVKKMLVTATFREFDYDFVFSNTEQEGEIPEGHIQDFIFDETDERGMDTKLFILFVTRVV